MTAFHYTVILPLPPVPPKCFSPPKKYKLLISLPPKKIQSTLNRYKKSANELDVDG
jgi:hypothetical protein